MKVRYISSGEKQTLTVTVDYDIAQRLYKAAVRHKLSRSAITERALDQYLEKLEERSGYEEAFKEEFTTQP